MFVYIYMNICIYKQKISSAISFFCALWVNKIFGFNAKWLCLHFLEQKGAAVSQSDYI